MENHRELQGDVAVLRLEGDDREAFDKMSLPDHVDTLVSSGITKVVLDYSGAGWLGSESLGAIAKSMLTLRKAGGDLVFTPGPKRYFEVYIPTGFKFYDSVEDAIASFNC